MARMEGKNLLITGGAGFLGYYLVQAPLHWNRTRSPAKPIRVTLYDNYIRGMPDWLSNLEGNPNLTLVTHDMCNPLPADMGDFAFIIHAASIASPTYYRRYPIETMDSNITGLRNLLNYSLAQKKKGKPVEGFLFYSSSEIYGDPAPDQIPTPEDYRGNVSCTGPRACYDESKRFGETLCVNFAQQHDLQITMARPFNNYGPGLKITDGRALPDFARDVINGRDIVMFSDGSPRRTFCYSSDAITGYYKVLVKGRKGEPYNVGIDRPEISVADLAELTIATAKELLGYEGKLVRKESLDKDYLIDNPNRRCPVIDKARNELGYQPKVLPKEGVRRALIWYAHNRVAEEK
ncbi:MAG: NAD-dependent epimerase/dehydratase family protein [Alphaproteobacteria bacterium]|nr:NAD-dependent epimerase/dehydratase family protein [Alphaproteobacteria bacterium]